MLIRAKGMTLGKGWGDLQSWGAGAAPGKGVRVVAAPAETAPRLWGIRDQEPSGQGVKLPMVMVSPQTHFLVSILSLTFPPGLLYYKMWIDNESVLKYWSKFLIWLIKIYHMCLPPWNTWAVSLEQWYPLEIRRCWTNLRHLLPLAQAQGWHAGQAAGMGSCSSGSSLKRERRLSRRLLWPMLREKCL